jgi:hypothetical protein
MQNAPVIEVQKWVLQVLNNVCEIERKLAKHGDPANARRNLERIKEAFEEQKVFFEDPMGQEFNETRTDLEASIAGSGSEALRVVEVIKPIIRVGDRQYSKVVQKGIVVVESTKPDETQQSAEGEQQ